MNNDVNCIGTLFMTIPNVYNDIYEKILLLFSEYGLDAIKDCKVSCRDKQSHIVDCFNIFTSGVAAWNAGRYKEANLIMNYIRGQLTIYYPNKDYNSSSIYFVLLNKSLSNTDITVDSIKDYEIKVNNIYTKYTISCNNKSELYIVTDKTITTGLRTVTDSSKDDIIHFSKVGTITIENIDYNIYKPDISFTNTNSILTIF